MRNNILLLSLACLCFFGFVKESEAQSCFGSNYAQNEIGTQTFSMTNSSNVAGISVPARSNHISVLQGIHYKRYMNFSAFRASFRYVQYNVEDPITDCSNCMFNDGVARAANLRLGWEFMAILNRFEPYAGLDAVFSHGWYDGKLMGDGLSGAYEEYSDSRRKGGIGVSPVAGFRVYFAYAFSISFETSLDIMMYSANIKQIRTFPDTQFSNQGVNTTEVLFNPLSNVSLNVMF